MSNPEETSAALDLANFDTFEGKVRAVVTHLAVDEQGNYQLPENVAIPEDIRFAATLEKRRRDTESTLGKTKAQLKALEARASTLEQKVSLQVTANLTEDEQQALQHLLETDSEAWRRKMNDLEGKAKQQLQTELDSVSTETSQQIELERRGVVLAEFNSLHPDVQITSEVIENDIPPRIVNKLTKGDITFEEFLEASHEYLTKPKSVGSIKPTSQPNLNRAGGGANPRPEAIKESFSATYKNTTF